VTAVGAWIPDFSTLANEEFGIVRWLADQFLTFRQLLSSL